MHLQGQSETKTREHFEIGLPKDITTAVICENSAQRWGLNKVIPQRGRMIYVKKSSSIPLYEQIYQTARDTITSGGVKPGDKLPSVRGLMKELEVSRNTVLNAYDRLGSEGYIKGIRGSGYFVVDRSNDKLRAIAAPERTDEERKSDIVPRASSPVWKDNFCYSNLPSGSFPSDIWRRIVSDILYPKNDVKLSSYGDNRGELGLRKEIAKFLNRARGILCSPNQIVLTSGTQESIERILLLFDNSVHRFAMEDPGYDGVRVVVENRGFALDPIRTDHGMNTYLSDVKNSNAKLLYATPSHQMPLGWNMDAATRTKLLKLVAAKNIYLIEDDYDCEYRFDHPPLPALSSLDHWERVIYLGTFSKILTPALRMSYIVLPPKLMNRFNSVFSSYYCTVPWLEQEAVRRFMGEGYWQHHVDCQMKSVRERHALMLRCLNKHFRDRIEIVNEDAGLHLLVHVKCGMNQDELVARAAEAGVNVETTHQYWVDASRSPDDLVLIGYSSAMDETIQDGVKRLARAWGVDEASQ